MLIEVVPMGGMPMPIVQIVDVVSVQHRRVQVGVRQRVVRLGTLKDALLVGLEPVGSSMAFQHGVHR